MYVPSGVCEGGGGCLYAGGGIEREGERVCRIVASGLDELLWACALCGCVSSPGQWIISYPNKYYLPRVKANQWTHVLIAGQGKPGRAELAWEEPARILPIRVHPHRKHGQ